MATGARENFNSNRELDNAFLKLVELKRVSKYFFLKKGNKLNNNKESDSVASYMGPGTKGPFYCNYCDRKLDCLDQDTREYLCIHCNISYFSDRQNVKRPNKFETPGPEIDIHGNVFPQDKPLLTSICPETWNELRKEKEKLPDFYEALKARGFKWTSFEERVG